jgi:excisionase family DNA binding protein
MTTDEFLTPEEAAKLLKVTRRTIYNWLKAGKVPAVQFGRGWRIRREDLMPKQPKKAA